MTISNLKPFMAYLTFEQYAKLKRFSVKNATTMSQLIRESIDARIAVGDRYSLGYNAAIKDAMKVVTENKAAKMRFPSGKSFADLVNEDIKSHLIKENTDEREAIAVEDEGGSTEGSPGSKGQADSDLGL